MTSILQVISKSENSKLSKSVYVECIDFKQKEMLSLPVTCMSYTIRAAQFSFKG